MTRDPERYTDEADYRARARPILTHPSRCRLAHNPRRQQKNKQKPERHDGEVSYTRTRRDRKKHP
ncbi:hypothetical protein LCGC14_1788740 [marine sediment metagenome]|uniref:Uncharacterized protein n=1 Tax=marine sediment metagenome TaxID=412755 RepID=A0A0F9HFR8_9ZZZZ